jgi:rubrerythrin
LKAGKTSLLQTVNPDSVEARQMARLRELFDVVIEVKRRGDRMEYAFRKHPAEFEEEWHGFSLSEVFVPQRSAAEFCIRAMEYELKNARHYSRNLGKFDGEGRRVLFGLSQASLKHFGELEELLKEVLDAAEPKPASTDELLKVLEEGMLEERVMQERYKEYSDEAGEEKAAAVFRRLSEEENAHALMVKRLKEKISAGKE